MRMRIQGIIVPLLTPYDERGHVYIDTVRPLVDFLIDRGVSALMPAGTTGEGPLLTTQERRGLAEAVVRAADGRVPIIIHTGAITTAEAIELTLHAQDIGAQAVSLIPPFYFHYSDVALFDYFRSVAECAPELPIYLYNNPPVTGNALSLNLIARLVEQCPNIVGIKDSSGGLELLAGCARLHNGEFNTANGSDANVLDSLKMGVHACVSGNANVAPELVIALYRACRSGEAERAQELQRKLDAVRQILCDGVDLSLFKRILALRGLPLGGARPPLPQVSEAQVQLCWQELRREGVELGNVI